MINKSFIVAGLVAAAVSATSAQAAYVISTSGVAVTENFDSYAGTDNPANWTVTGGSAFRGQNTGSNNQNGIWAFGTSEYSLGFLASSSSTTVATATVDFVNSTGSALNSLAIAFDGEEWRIGGRASTISVSYSIDGGSAIALGDLTYTAPDASGGTNGKAGSGEATHLSTMISDLNVANGSTITLSFVYNGNGSSGTGARSGLSIDNLSVIGTGSPVPEPASVGILALAGAGLLLRRKKA